MKYFCGIASFIHITASAVITVLKTLGNEPTDKWASEVFLAVGLLAYIGYKLAEISERLKSK